MLSFRFQLSKPLITLSSLTSFDSNSPIQPLHQLSFSIFQLPFSRSESAQIPPEEPSHLASLMAGDYSLGPSDAPCLVESSTAHGGYIFWVVTPWISDEISVATVQIFLTQSIVKPRYAPKHDQRLAPKYRSPATASSSDQATVVVPCRKSRHERRLRLKKGGIAKTLIVQLGFSHGMGFSNFSPLRHLSRPMTELIGLAQVATWLRFVHLSILSNPNLLMLFYVVENGRRLHLHNVLTLIIRIDNYHLITMEEDLASAIDLFISSKNLMLQSASLIERTFAWSSISLLQNHRTLSLNPFFERWCDSCHQNPSKRPQPGIVFSPVSVPQFSRTMLEYSRKTSGFTSRTALLLDLKGPRRPRSSIVESTSAPPSSVMERNRSNLLVAAGLASARHEAKNPSLTPQNLLIMACYEIPDSFVEVSLTHPSLACDMLLVSLCFRDPRDLSFNLFVRLIHLLYVCKIVLQNFVSYVPLFWVD